MRRFPPLGHTETMPRHLTRFDCCAFGDCQPHTPAGRMQHFDDRHDPAPEMEALAERVWNSYYPEWKEKKDDL